MTGEGSAELPSCGLAAGMEHNRTDLRITGTFKTLSATA